LDRKYPPSLLFSWHLFGLLSKLRPAPPRVCKAAVTNPAAAQDMVLCRALAWPRSSAGASKSETSTAFPSLGDSPAYSRDNFAPQAEEHCMAEPKQKKKQELRRTEVRIYQFWSFVCNNSGRRSQREELY